MKKDRLIKLFAISSALMLLAPFLALAQQQVPQVPLTLSFAYNLFLRIMNWVFSFALVLAVIIIIWGGVTYMTAGGDETKIGNAKKRVLYGLLGVVIIVAAWGLIFLISQFITGQPYVPPAGGF